MFVSLRENQSKPPGPEVVVSSQIKVNFCAGNFEAIRPKKKTMKVKEAYAKTFVVLQIRTKRKFADRLVANFICSVKMMCHRRLQRQVPVFR